MGKCKFCAVDKNEGYTEPILIKKKVKIGGGEVGYLSSSLTFAYKESKYPTLCLDVDFVKRSFYKFYSINYCPICGRNLNEQTDIRE